MLLYVDDVLMISDNARNILDNEIGKYFTMKPVSIGPPEIYLGGHMRKITLENGSKAWGFSSSQYVQAAMKNIEDILLKLTASYPTKPSHQFRPHTDQR